MVTSLRQVGGYVHRRLLCRVSPNEERGRSCHAGGRTLWAISHRLTTRPIPQPVLPAMDLDPIGLRSLRWWDGAQWGRHGTILLHNMECSAPVSGRYRLRFRRRRRGRQPGVLLLLGAGRPHGGVGDAPDLPPGTIPPVRTQAQPGSRPASKTRRDRWTSSPARRDCCLQRTTHHGSGGNRKAPGAPTGLGRPDRIIVAISAANLHGSPPAANVAPMPTTSAAGDDAEGWDTAVASAEVKPL